MWNKGFEGWYFKHQVNDFMLAFIPGRSRSGAFVQMITPAESRQFDVHRFTVKKDNIYADNCIFSPAGIEIDLPCVRGRIEYSDLVPLRSDIMGPFSHLPMQCRHGVVSMSHSLKGSVEIDGVERCFDTGLGYIEKDSGRSFPQSYLWMQCNDFCEPCSIMVSIAHIPFCGFSFTGCLCAIVYQGKEYRLATYRGVRIIEAHVDHIKLSQGKLLLDIDIIPTDSSHTLRSPVKGRMSGTVRESCNAHIRVRFWKKEKLLFDLLSRHAVYEAML